MSRIIVVGADDWQPWSMLRLRALRDAPSAFGSRYEDWADAPARRWRERLRIPGAHDLVAADGRGAWIGMASGIPGDSRSEPSLISMWVEPSVRRRGIAAQLVDAVAAWAASTGGDALQLSVVPTNLPAIEAYRCCGFEPVDDPGDPLPDGAGFELRMRKPLGPPERRDV